jgi:hypothetical protein
MAAFSCARSPFVQHPEQLARARRDYHARMRFVRGTAFCGVLVWAFSLFPACPPIHAQTSAPDLTATQIVEQIRKHTLDQKSGLKQYTALRHYQVEYRGFSAKINAKMDVEVRYGMESGKSFRIISESGSNLLRDKVLKRAVESEKEASHDTAATALNEANYRFKMLGTDRVNERTAYILNVEPITASKFLFRGRVWVDTTDFAVIKMETEPAKNPSFWIARTLIHYTSAKTEGFWLPQMMQSETKVRIGGTAVLTIDYGSYDIEPKSAPAVAPLGASLPTGR